MRKKSYLLFLLCACLFILLIGCGSGDKAIDSETNGDGTPEVTIGNAEPNATGTDAVTATAPEETEAPVDLVFDPTPEEAREIVNGYFSTAPESPFAFLPEDNILGTAYTDKTLFEEYYQKTITELGVEAPPPGWDYPRELYAEATVKADQAAVGEERQIRFDKTEDTIQFAYTYDTKTGKERLAMLLYHSAADEYRITAGMDGDRGIPMYIVCETELGGLDGLCRVIDSGELFSVRVLSAENVAYKEYEIAWECVSSGLYAIDDYAVDIKSPPQSECDVIRAVGSVGTSRISDRLVQRTVVYANVTVADEGGLSEIYDDFQVAFDIYGLGEYIQIKP